MWHVSDGLWEVHAEKNMWIQERERERERGGGTEWDQMQNAEFRKLYSSPFKIGV